MERLGTIEKTSASKGARRAYFIIALVLITFHTFLDGMGFHVESALSHATSHEHGHEHAHTHDFYSFEFRSFTSPFSNWRIYLS